MKSLQVKNARSTVFSPRAPTQTGLASESGLKVGWPCGKNDRLVLLLNYARNSLASNALSSRNKDCCKFDDLFRFNGIFSVQLWIPLLRIQPLTPCALLSLGLLQGWLLPAKRRSPAYSKSRYLQALFPGSSLSVPCPVFLQIRQTQRLLRLWGCCCTFVDAWTCPRSLCRSKERRGFLLRSYQAQQG